MLMEVKKHLKLVFICFKYNIIRAIDNRVSFIAQVLGMILNNGIMIIQWIVLFSLKDNIGGYGFKDVLIMWALASSAYGVAHALFNNSFVLSKLIINGKLDAFLVQPKNTLVYLSASSSSVSAIGDILYGLLIMIFIRASLVNFLLFIFLTLIGGIIMAAVAIIWHSLTFYLNNADDFADIMNSNMVNIATYPEGIFSKETRWLFYTLLPVGFTVYLPIQLLKVWNPILFIILILFTILICIIAYIIFYKGLKKYSSSNLMSARI